LYLKISQSKPRLENKIFNVDVILYVIVWGKTDETFDATCEEAVMMPRTPTPPGREQSG
jgi:hypothetical protein